MTSRSSFVLVASLLALLVVSRAFPFVWWPHSHFDSDQAIVGLMAKHISEGRAFPLYFYGQDYMLAVEAYLAAPVMWMAGPTVTALKFPLVVINVLVVVLLLRILVRDARLGPWVAAIAVLPLALPAAGIAARVTEANGGNVEPWLYVLLLWAARERPFWLGLVLGVGVLHREFTAYGAAALLVLDGLAVVAARLDRRLAIATLSRWTAAALVMLAVRAAAAAVRPYAQALGPGTTGDDPALLIGASDAIGGRLCFMPETWPSRTAMLISDHLPRLVGGMPAPLQDYGVLSGVYSGNPGLGVWVAMLTVIGMASGAWFWWRRRAVEVDADADAATDRAMPHVGGYLVLVALVSTLVYAFATCSDIRVQTMRYNLLGVMMPAGALVMALQTWRQPVVRAGFGAAVVLWCLLNAADVAALTHEYATRRPPDNRQALASELEARGVTHAWTRFRFAYHTTFLARERVRLSATDFMRIRAYADEAAAVDAPTLSENACANGTPLSGGVFLCP